MKLGNLVYISGQNTLFDYLRLNLQMGSTPEEWDKAITIFDDRIYGRFLKPIRLLLGKTNNNMGVQGNPPGQSIYQMEVMRQHANEAALIPNGFAIMALICLLMETLMQFKEGLPVTPVGENKYRYTDFLKNNMNFSHHNAKRFYEDVRCGILHSGEIKNNSCLSIKQKYPITTMGTGAITVDVHKLAYKLFDYYKMYCRDLRKETNDSLRINFVRKMDSITKKWEYSPKFNTLWNAICAKRGQNLEVSSEEIRSITHTNDWALQFDNNVEVLKVDVCEAVCFWNDVESINAREDWKYIVPLLNSCHEISDTFIVKAG